LPTDHRLTLTPASTSRTRITTTVVCQIRHRVDVECISVGLDAIGDGVVIVTGLSRDIRLVAIVGGGIPIIIAPHNTRTSDDVRIAGANVRLGVVDMGPWAYVVLRGPELLLRHDILLGPIILLGTEVLRRRRVALRSVTVHVSGAGISRSDEKSPSDEGGCGHG